MVLVGLILLEGDEVSAFLYLSMGLTLSHVSHVIEHILMGCANVYLSSMKECPIIMTKLIVIRCI